MNIAEIEAKKSEELIDKPKTSVIHKAARIWLVIGVIILVAVVLGVITMAARGITEQAEKAKRIEKIRADKDQLHIETLKGLQAENDAWSRLNKSMRSARTDEERARIRAEAAKVRALKAERERITAMMKSQLDAEELRLQR